MRSAAVAGSWISRRPGSDGGASTEGAIRSTPERNEGEYMGRVEDREVLADELKLPEFAVCNSSKPGGPEGSASFP